jgi:hypothetical protein
MVKPYGYIDYSVADISSIDGFSDVVHSAGTIDHNLKTVAPDHWSDVQLQTAIRESKDRF